MQRDAGLAVAAPAGPRILDGQGLSVRRRPLDPGRPIDYARLSPCSLSEGVTADNGHAAGYEAGYADGQRDAESAARDAERAGAGPGRRGRGRAAAARSMRHSAAYEERVRPARGRGAAVCLRAAGGAVRARVGARVDPGRDAIARALALDESTLPGSRPAFSRRCSHHRRTGRSVALSPADGGR